MSKVFFICIFLFSHKKINKVVIMCFDYFSIQQYLAIWLVWVSLLTYWSPQPNPTVLHTIQTYQKSNICICYIFFTENFAKHTTKPDPLFFDAFSFRLFSPRKKIDNNNVKDLQKLKKSNKIDCRMLSSKKL